MSLIDLITGNTGDKVAEEAENKFGVSKNQILALLAIATPLIISYLRNKSQDPKEAEALNSTLDKNHDGSILNNPSEAKDKEEEGGSILNHIFGSKKPEVENQLSSQTGISLSKIGPILAILAPIVMGYIGKQKQESNVTSGGGLSDLLGGILGNAHNQAQTDNSNPLNNILGSVLAGGSQSNNNPLGDILGSVIGGGNQSSGGLGGILGSILGGKK